MINLPVEVLDQVASYLPPADALHLAYTSKAFYKVVQPRLYTSITVDSNKYPHDHEVIKKNSLSKVPGVFGCRGTSVKPTKIKSLYGLHLVFKNLRENPQLCHHIQVLTFCNIIPDIPEVELFDNLAAIFPRLTNLRVLSWLAILVFLSCELISLLPSHLVLLTGNFKGYEGWLMNPMFLRELNVSGFNTVGNLVHLDLTQFPRLDKLIISRNSSSHNNTLVASQNQAPHQYAISDLIEVHEPILEDGADFLKTAFGRPFSHKLHLLTLILKDIAIKQSDAQYLIGAVHLEGLKELSLNNCTELLFEELLVAPSPLRRTPPQHSFLDLISPHLVSLDTLDINLHNELYYNEKVFKFLETTPGLRRLSVFLNFNNYENINGSLLRLFRIIAQHSMLEYLNFNFNIVNLSTTLNINNVVKPVIFDYLIASIHNLSKLTNLQFLKLPLNKVQIPDLFRIISPIQTLKFLQLNLFHSMLEPSTPATFSSLIDQNYFDYPNSMTCTYNSHLVEQLRSYCTDFKQVLPNLTFLCFEKNGENYLFDCATKLRREGLADFFDHLVRDCCEK